MLNHYMNDLKHSIQWAQFEDSIEVLNLAKTSMQRLMDFVDDLPIADRLAAHLQIDEVLPMEWPLWMEACRYDDKAMNIATGASNGTAPTLH